MVTLQRAKRNEELQNTPELRPMLMKTCVPRQRSTGSTARAHIPVNESTELLDMRLNELNISTSFLSSLHCDESSSESSSSIVGADATHGMGGVVQCDDTADVSADGPRPADTRQFVLERIGDMLDSGLLSDNEAMDAIALAMLNDNTYDLMSCLVRSRNTLDGQSTFLKMWLKTQNRTGHNVSDMEPSRIAPPPLHVSYRTLSDEPEVIRPRPVYHAELPAAKPSELVFPPAPAASPPLMPIALQFADGSPCPSPIPWSGRGPTPSILMSNTPASIILKRATSTPSTGDSAARLVFGPMRIRSTASSDEGGV